jgi:hypothetical protein
MYEAYQAYWQTLVQELQRAETESPTLFRELRYGALRGLIHPL